MPGIGSREPTVVGLNRTQDGSVSVLHGPSKAYSVQKERLTRRKHHWGRPGAGLPRRRTGGRDVAPPRTPVQRLLSVPVHRGGGDGDRRPGKPGGRLHRAVPVRGRRAGAAGSSLVLPV